MVNTPSDFSHLINDLLELLPDLCGHWRSLVIH